MPYAGLREAACVDRRIGGLEIHLFYYLWYYAVDRRIGGLENY